MWNRTPERAAASLRSSAARPSRPARGRPSCSSTALRSDSTERGVFSRSTPLRADDTSRYECVVDLVYTATETALVQAARARSVAAVDGLQLLVGQGALSFERFTGIAAPAARDARGGREDRDERTSDQRLRAVWRGHTTADRRPEHRRRHRRPSGAAGSGRFLTDVLVELGFATRSGSRARSRRPESARDAARAAAGGGVDDLRGSALAGDRRALRA